MIVVVDHGLGNLRSVAIKFARLKVEATVSADPVAILAADKLILPGVGSFDTAMNNLRSTGLVEALNEAVLERETPILGICLGMQLFTRGSEEGSCPGLGWINGETRKLIASPGDEKIRVPHVGWNTVVVRRRSPLFTDISPGLRYYFVHSYAVFCDDSEQIAAETSYGQTFASAVTRDNIYGTQFHPEKSHRHGLAMLENFVKRVG